MMLNQFIDFGLNNVQEQSLLNKIKTLLYILKLLEGGSLALFAILLHG